MLKCGLKLDKDSTYTSFWQTTKKLMHAQRECNAIDKRPIEIHRYLEN